MYPTLVIHSIYILVLLYMTTECISTKFKYNEYYMKYTNIINDTHKKSIMKIRKFIFYFIGLGTINIQYVVVRLSIILLFYIFNLFN